MWVSRTHYESLFENVTTSRSRLAEAQARIASLEATQAWLMQHVNRLEHERRLLTEARLGLQFPQPTLARERETDPAEVTHGLPPSSMPLAQMLAASMEDVGDEAARALGLSHDASGQLAYGC